MATRGDAPQTATQQQVDSADPVVFLDTHLTKLDDRKIKRIGLYTKSDLAELNQLLTDLHRIFTLEYGLYDRQTIYLRVNGETNTRKFVTDLNFPEAVEEEDPSKRRDSLFLSDLARIIVGLAKTFNAIWQPDELKAFTPSFDELKQVSDWSPDGYPDYLSEFELARNYKRIHALLDLVTRVFEQQTGVQIGEDTKENEASQAPTQLAGTATVPAPTSTSSTSRVEDDDSDGADDTPDPQEVLEENLDITTEVTFVTSTAYHNLVAQFLQQAGIGHSDLSPELQVQLTQLNDAIRNKLWDVIGQLSPEQREKLLNHSLRTYLYQKLLIELLRDPQFYPALTNLYQGYAQHLSTTLGPQRAEEQLTKLEQYFSSMAATEEIDANALQEVVQALRQNISQLKKDIAQVSATPLNQQQKDAVFVAVYELLINPIAKEVESFPGGVDYDYSQTLSSLETLYRSEIERALASLDPTKITSSLSKTDVLSSSGFVYQQVLSELLSSQQFFSQLADFYQLAINLGAKNNSSAVTNRLEEIENYLRSLSVAEEIDQANFLRAVEKLLTAISNLGTQKAVQAPAESVDTSPPITEVATDVTTDQSQPDHISHADLDDHAINRLPPPKIRFHPQQEQQLAQFLSNGTGLDDRERRLVQDQSARLLWGTLAELFKDDSEQLQKLPDHLRDDVFNQTLNYMMSLSKDDLQKLRTSPSSLIRHIKNNSYRILGEANFQKAYQQYAQFKTAETLSRASRIEKETQWAYQQIMFELFGAHNINDPSVPDEPGLQDVFDHLKEYLREDLFAYIEQLPTEDLINLYVHAKDRTKFIDEIFQYLNADSAFIENLSEFYNNLLDHYETTNQQAAKQQLQTSLNSMVKVDGQMFSIKAGAPPPRELLDNSLSHLLDTDSKVLLDLTDGTIRSMVLSIGLADTINLIQGNNAEMLGVVFNLPKGMLNANNLDAFRSLLVDYANARATQLQISAHLPDGGIIGGRTTQNQSGKSDASSQMESVRTVQVVVQAKGGNEDEVIAQASNAKSIKEKRDITMKIFGGEWNQLTQQEQIAIYIYFGLIDKNTNIDKYKKDINQKLPFVFEYIDFRAKKDYKTLVETLSAEYERHGVRDFNPLFKSSFLEGTPAADEQRKINEMLLAIQAYNFAQLSETEKLVIAQQVGYATAEAFLAEQLKGAELALSNNPEVSQWVASLPVVDGLMPENLEASTSFEQPSFLERFMGAQPLSGRARLLNSFRQLGGQKIQGETFKKGAAALAAKAGLGAATGGLATVAGIGLTILNNKKVRDVLIYGTTFVTASTLYALSTVGGALGALLGGAFGLVGGPLGAAGGGFFGAHAGAQIMPQQWGGWLGFSPRQAPSWGNFFSSEEPVSFTQSSMSAQRALNAAGGQPVAADALGSGQTTLGVTPATPQSMNVGLAGGAGNYFAGGSTAPAASSGLFGGVAGLSIGLAAPLIGVASVTLLTMITILVISGAFIVPLPIRNSSYQAIDPDNPGIQPGAEFVEITKEASITQIENNTPTEVTYTITITPKGANKLVFNSIEDTFNVFGEQVPAVMPQSPFSETYFGEVVSEPVTTTYTTTIGADTVNAIATNNIIARFDVVDANDYTIQTNQAYRVSESVKIGTPKVGCWPVSGYITQLPYSGDSTHKATDSFDIGAPLDTPVYAPFDGTLSRFDTANYPWNYGWGRSVKLTSNIQGQTVTFIFAHLNSAEVGYGQSKEVVAGELIGAVNNDGNSTGNHLHIEIKPIVPGLSLTELLDAEDEVQSFMQGKTTNVYDCRTQ